MAVQAVAAEHSDNFDVPVEDNEDIVLVLAVRPALFAHELDLFVDEFGLVLPREMAVHVVLLEERFAHIEDQFFLKSKEG